MPSLQNPVTVLSEPWRAKTRTGGDERSAAATFAGASALVRPGSEASPGPPPPLSTLLALGDRIWGTGASLGAALQQQSGPELPDPADPRLIAPQGAAVLAVFSLVLHDQEGILQPDLPAEV